MKHTVLAASLFLGCMSISVFASDLLASERKLGVVYSLNDDKYIGKIREIDQDEKNKIIEVIKLLKEEVVGEPEDSSVTTSLKLVIQTEFPWIVSDIPDYQKDKSHDCKPPESEACLNYLPENYPDYFKYMSGYIDLLREKNVKFTPLLGFHAPDWLKLSFNVTGGANQFGHAIPFPISKKDIKNADEENAINAWNRVDIWLKETAKILRGYTLEQDGQEPTIQEILLTNEMVYIDSQTGKRYLTEELIDFLRKKRSTFIEYLNNKDVKVGWKLPASLVIDETEDNLGKLLSGIDLVGVNVEEGDKYTCCTVRNIITKINNTGFNGTIYISEYNTESGATPLNWSDTCTKIPSDDTSGAVTVGKFSSDQLKNCILTSFDQGVAELTFYKWNEVVSDAEKQDVLSGLHDAFQSLRCDFPDVPISDQYNAIIKLCEMGVLHGYPDGTFKPKLPVNRAEFSKMLVKLAENEEIGKKFSEITIPADIDELVRKFQDLEREDQNGADTWYLSYIGKLKEGVLTLDKDGNEYFKGIIDGYPDGLFRPGKTINMAEMLKMIIQTFAEAAPDKKGDEWYMQYLLPATGKIEPIWDVNKFRSATEDDAEMPVTRAMAAKAMYDAYLNFKK